MHAYRLIWEQVKWLYTTSNLLVIQEEEVSRQDLDANTFSLIRRLERCCIIYWQFLGLSIIENDAWREDLLSLSWNSNVWIFNPNQPSKLKTGKMLCVLVIAPSRLRQKAQGRIKHGLHGINSCLCIKKNELKVRWKEFPLLVCIHIQGLILGQIN